MKILIIARGYPTDKYILNGIFEFDQAKALRKLGHEVFFMSLDIRSLRRVRRFGTYELEKEGVLIHNCSIPCGKAPFQVQNFMIRQLLRKQYPAFVKKHGEPDIIHVHFLNYGYCAVKELKKTGIPLVITEHSFVFMDGLFRSKAYKTGYTAYEGADELICVSNALAGQISDKFGVKATVIPNIVDTAVFRYSGKKKTAGSFMFVCVANLNVFKRIDFLIDVFAEVSKQHPDIRLTVVGDGPERKHISDLVTLHKLEDKVCLKGRQSRKAIKQVFDEADCFVLPSAVETFGVAYIEALASGLPVIATRCGGPEDFVDESNGILVDVDNREELHAAMEDMISNINKYHPKKISERTKDKFSDVRIAERIEEVYLKVIKNQR